MEQQVSFFESSQVPVDLMLMIDTSSSMADKMDVVHEAAINFLRTLRQGDRGAVVSFADGVQILEKLSAEKPRLEQAVHQTAAHGGTALNNALYVALREFGGTTRDDGPVRRRAIALLTDGDDTSSVVSFDDVMGLARKAGVNIYTIALQTQPIAASAPGHRFLSASQFSLKSLAQETGGPGLLPDTDHGAADRVRFDCTGALEPVLDRILALELARGRPIPPDRCAGGHPSGDAPEGSRRVHGGRRGRTSRQHPALTRQLIGAAIAGSSSHGRCSLVGGRSSSPLHSRLPTATPFSLQSCTRRPASSVISGLNDRSIWPASSFQCAPDVSGSMPQAQQAR